MITLLEHEGKAMLRERGIAVPQGVLYGDAPLPAMAGYVVKAQVPAGGRGRIAPENRSAPLPLWGGVGGGDYAAST